MSSEAQIEIWLDAPISRKLPKWVERQFKVRCRHLLGLGLREAEDDEIFAAAKAACAVLVTKDRDFAALGLRKGPPPQIVLLTSGNASNDDLKAMLIRGLPFAIARIRKGDPLVEISRHVQ